jgi:hypothetical protein
MVMRLEGTAAVQGTGNGKEPSNNALIAEMRINDRQSSAAGRARPSNMKKRVLPDLVKFDAPGVTVSGVLVRMNLKKGDTKNYVEYILHNVDEDKIYRFNGSYEIDNQIFRTDLHKSIEVTFVGEDKTVMRNGNALKKFEVWVDEGKPVARPSGGDPGWQATDEDIPF